MTMPETVAIQKSLGSIGFADCLDGSIPYGIYLVICHRYLSIDILAIPVGDACKHLCSDLPASAIE